MIARKCDLCKKYYESYGNHETTSNGISTMYLAKDPIIERSKKMITYDLCPECMEEFHKLIGLLTKEKTND